MENLSYTGRYTQAQVTSVDRERLLLLMFEGGTKFLRLSRDALAAGDLPRFGKALERAQAIITELLGTLDYEAGGPIAANLGRLYEFMLFRLTEANAERSVAAVEQVLRVFGTIAGAFQQILARTDRDTQRQVA